MPNFVKVIVIEKKSVTIKLEMIINILLLAIKLKWAAVIGVSSHVVPVAMLCLAKQQNYGFSEEKS